MPVRIGPPLLNKDGWATVRNFIMWHEGFFKDGFAFRKEAVGCAIDAGILMFRFHQPDAQMKPRLGMTWLEVGAYLDAQVTESWQASQVAECLERGHAD